MRKTLFLLLLAVSSTLAVQAATTITPQPGSLQEGLAFYWDFNNGSTDYQTATGMNTSINTGISAANQHATGGIGNSGYISSNNGSSRIDFYNGLSGAGIKANSFTISLKVSGLTADYRDMLCFTLGSETFDLQTTNSSDGNKIALYSSGDHTLLTGNDTSSALKGESWGNIVITSDGTNLTLYVNGIKASIAFSPEASATLSNFQLSSKWGDSERAANANYDDLAIWDRALTQEEINHLVAGGTAGDLLVPEPATATLSLLGLAALMVRRRRIG